MNLRDLKYLLEVAREQHFARAAEKSFVSQPALSMQIKKLEDELGVKIFERDKKNFLVTKVGEEILKKVEIVLHEVEEIKNCAKNSKDPFGCEFTIGAFPTLASYFFPEAVKKISKKFPRLKIFLVEEKTDELIKKLQLGEIDAAFLALPLNNNNFESVKIFEEEFLLAVPKNHELTKKKQIQLKDLRGKELMLLNEGHCLRDQALQVCSMSNAFAKANFQATSLETLRQMIALGRGITLMPKIAVKKDEQISYLKIKQAPKRQIGFFWRKNLPQKEVAKALAKLLS